MSEIQKIRGPTRHNESQNALEISYEHHKAQIISTLDDLENIRRVEEKGSIQALREELALAQTRIVLFTKLVHYGETELATRRMPQENLICRLIVAVDSLQKDEEEASGQIGYLGERARLLSILDDLGSTERLGQNDSEQALLEGLAVARKRISALTQLVSLVETELAIPQELQENLICRLIVAVNSLQFGDFSMEALEHIDLSRKYRLFDNEERALWIDVEIKPKPKVSIANKKMCLDFQDLFAENKRIPDVGNVAYFLYLFAAAKADSSLEIKSLDSKDFNKFAEMMGVNKSINGTQSEINRTRQRLCDVPIGSLKFSEENFSGAQGYKWKGPVICVEKVRLEQKLEIIPTKIKTGDEWMNHMLKLPSEALSEFCRIIGIDLETIDPKVDIISRIISCQRSRGSLSISARDLVYYFSTLGEKAQIMRTEKIETKYEFFGYLLQLNSEEVQKFGKFTTKTESLPEDEKLYRILLIIYKARKTANLTGLSKRFRDFYNEYIRR